MNDAITAEEILDMVRHWLHCPPNGYLGGDYGCDLKSLLQQPQAGGLANAFIDKMHEDLPILDSWRGDINVYMRNQGVDGKRLVIEIPALGFVDSVGVA